MSQTHETSKTYYTIESIILIFIWLIIFFIPLITNHVDNVINWNRVLSSWIKISAFFILFILNFYLLIPRFLKRKKYEKYILLILAITPFIICISFKLTETYTLRSNTGMPPMELGPGMPPMELSEKMSLPTGFKINNKSQVNSTEILFLQSFAIALLIIGTGTAYKVIYFWLEEEKEKKILQLQVQNENQQVEDFIFVKSDFKMVKIPMSDILYIESANEYIKIYLEKGESVTTFMRLKHMEEKLPADRFMRVQRSFIVNLEKIQAVEKNRIYIEQKKFIPIGEQFKESFQQYLGKNFIK